MGQVLCQEQSQGASQDTSRMGQAEGGQGEVTVSTALSPQAEYQTSIQEKLPLIIGSSAAGLVFLIAVVVIAIVCNRCVGGPPV